MVSEEGAKKIEELNKKNEEKKKIVRMYVDKKMSTTVIGGLLRKGSSEIMEILEEMGVKLRGQQSEVKKRYHF